MKRITVAAMAACVVGVCLGASTDWIPVGATGVGLWSVNAKSVRPVGENGASFWAKLVYKPGHSGVANEASSDIHVQGTCAGDTVTLTSYVGYDKAGREIGTSTNASTVPAPPDSAMEQLMTAACGALHPGKY